MEDLNLNKIFKLDLFYADSWLKFDDSFFEEVLAEKLIQNPVQGFCCQICISCFQYNASNFLINKNLCVL